MRNDNSFVRISGKLADFLGFKASSGRYIAREALTPIEGAFQLWKEAGDAIDDAARAARDAAKSLTISNKQRSTQSLRSRTGEPSITREKYTREVRTGKRKYHSETTKRRQTNARNSRQIREYLPDIAPKDKAVALKHLDKGYYSLTPAERDRFHKMFKRYNSDDVRQALGSAPKDIGRFRLAA